MLHPTARAIVDALTQHAPTGVQLDRAVLMKLAQLIPRDLTAEELVQALAQLRANSRARTAAEVIASVDETVRRVRCGEPAVTPHPHADAFHGPGTDDTSATARRRGGGGAKAERPVTSPNHVEVSDAWSLVHEFDAHDAGAWFEERGGDLVMTEAARSWTSQHEGAELGNGVLLYKVIHASRSRGPRRSARDRGEHPHVRRLLPPGRSARDGGDRDRRVCDRCHVSEAEAADHRSPRESLRGPPGSERSARSAPMRHTLYELDVRLREIEPAIWRTLEVPGACSLQQLHAASLADEVVEARSAVGPLVRRARKPTAPRGRQRTRS